MRHQSKIGRPETLNPSQHIGNATFAKDRCEALKGDSERTVIANEESDRSAEVRAEECVTGVNSNAPTNMAIVTPEPLMLL